MATMISEANSSSTTAAPTVLEAEHLVLKKKKEPKETFRKDYTPPLYWINHTDLHFDIQEGYTVVTSTLKILRDAKTTHGNNLVLHGEDLQLMSLSIDDKEILQEGDKPSSATSSFTLSEEGELSIQGSLFPSEASTPFTLKTKTKIIPETNTQLSGLYKSGGMYCTQCEAEGFRRITYYLDRPDVMSLFKVRIEASTDYSVLLSNGNEVKSGKLESDAARHYAEFEDPWLKPCYLFAVVAGKLDCIQDTFKTKDGKDVKLGLYSEPHNVDKLDWAMDSLKKAMKWDEDRWGRVYDLGVFNIVATDDFNMGAMENKGLNVFNSALLLSTKDMSTDGDYRRILGVVGHEYFHNWTGNRVTCRDWFQLTLKEGLTVYRDQEFSRDLTSPTVVRIEDVIVLRAVQFQEDGGPMAHPIRPESYVAMDNFYTSTVYNKGAEVIRMYATLLGKEGFRKGLDLYFERHDGQAVTCDDFRAAMSDANKKDFSQFERWYLQAGTPTLKVTDMTYDSSAKTYSYTCTQTTPATPGQTEKKPFHIPLKVALLSKAKGGEIVKEHVVELTKDKDTFTIQQVEEEPILSILRDFSAPVKLELERSDEELAFLAANDTDEFNKWEAGQVLGAKVIKDVYEELKGGKHESEISLPPFFISAWKKVLEATDLDKWVQTYALRLPDPKTLANNMTDVYDPCCLYKARQLVRSRLANETKDALLKLYTSLSEEASSLNTTSDTTMKSNYNCSNQACGVRALRNQALAYICMSDHQDATKLAKEHFTNAANATDKMAAMQCLTDMKCDERKQVLDAYYKEAKENTLMICKWLLIQSCGDVDNALEEVEKLLQHEDFSMKMPNKVRALVGGFCSNMPHFHRADGKGYEFLANQIQTLDKMNPQIASKLCTILAIWKKLEPERSALMKKQLERLRDTEGLSNDSVEIVTKSLR